MAVALVVPVSLEAQAEGAPALAATTWGLGLRMMAIQQRFDKALCRNLMIRKGTDILSNDYAKEFHPESDMSRC